MSSRPLPSIDFGVGDRVFIYRKHRWKGVIVEKITTKEKRGGGWDVRVSVSFTEYTRQPQLKVITLPKEDIYSEAWFKQTNGE